MDLLSGKPFWSVRNGLVASYPALAAFSECDVVVHGASVTGALVGEDRAKRAYCLCHAGLEEVANWPGGTFAEMPDGLPYIGRHPRVPHTVFALIAPKRIKRGLVRP